MEIARKMIASGLVVGGWVIILLQEQYGLAFLVLGIGIFKMCNTVGWD